MEIVLFGLLAVLLVFMFINTRKRQKQMKAEQEEKGQARHAADHRHHGVPQALPMRPDQLRSHDLPRMGTFWIRSATGARSLASDSLRRR